MDDLFFLLFVIFFTFCVMFEICLFLILFEWLVDLWKKNIINFLLAFFLEW